MGSHPILTKVLNPNQQRVILNFGMVFIFSGPPVTLLEQPLPNNMLTPRWT
jgi:hypothetical protein